MLIRAGALIDTVDHELTTALMYCAMDGQVETAKLLINAQAKLGLMSYSGGAALHFCAT